MTKLNSGRAAAAAAVGAFVSMVLAGEALAQAPADFIAAQPEALRPYFQVAYEEGERNAVLNFSRLGLAAMAAGNADIARKALDQAIQRVEAFRVAGTDIKAAKSKFQEEASKDFKGEPYERAMLYYYRGVLYLQSGDYANAAASFNNVNVEDSRAEDEQNQSDYASMKLLNAWALRCNGEENSSAEFSRQAQQLRPTLVLSDYTKPLMVMVETGRGPKKVGSGKFSEKLSFEDAQGDVDRSALDVVGTEGNPVTAPMYAEDVFFQASTRGGRPIEYLLAGKASFKDNMQKTANVSGAVAMASVQTANMQSAFGNNDAAMGALGVGAASALIGLFSSMAANRAQPSADLRAWDSLPRSLWLATLAPAANIGDVAVTVNGNKVAPSISGQSGSCSFAWVHASPVPAASRNQHLKIDDTREAKDRLKLFQGLFPTYF